MTETRTCAQCGRVGTRGYRPYLWGKLGEWECSNLAACLRRQHRARRTSMWAGYSEQ